MVSPKQSRNTQTVRKVEQAITLALKRCTCVRVEIRTEEQSASTIANKIAASPPNINSVRKMKVSETEI